MPTISVHTNDQKELSFTVRFEDGRSWTLKKGMLCEIEGSPASNRFGRRCIITKLELPRPVEAIARIKFLDTKKAGKADICDLIPVAAQ